MAISDELNRILNAKAGIRSALAEKGLTIGDSSTLDEYPALIEEMEVGGGGVDTSTLIDLIEGDLTTLVIPEGTTKIGQSAFQNRKNLTNITIPSNISNIGMHAFAGCTALHSLDLPAACTTIYNGLVKDCVQLEKFVIKSGVTDIWNEAFQNVSTGMSMAMLPTTPPTLYQTGNYIFGGSWPIYVKNSVVETYKNAGGNWNNVSTRIQPLAAMDYDASTYTVTALGRDDLELYVDASLCDSSVYTIQQMSEDASHVIMVKCVDPSLGVLDSSTMEVLVEGKPASILSTPHIFVDNTSISTDGQTLAAYTNENNVYVIKSVTNPCDIQDFPYNYNGSTDRSIYAYNTQSCYTNSMLYNNMPFESGVLTYDLNNHCIDFVPDSDNVQYHVSIYNDTAKVTLKYTINDVETVIDNPASFNLPYYINGNPEKIEMNILVNITDTNSNYIGDANGQLYILNDELMPETPAIPDISIYKHDNRNVYIVPVYDNSIQYESFICYSDNLTQDSNQTYGPYTYKIPTSGTRLRAGTYTLQTQVKLADYSPSFFTTFTIISTNSGVTNHEVIEVS